MCGSICIMFSQLSLPQSIEIQSYLLMHSFSKCKSIDDQDEKQAKGCFAIEHLKILQNYITYLNINFYNLLYSQSQDTQINDLSLNLNSNQRIQNLQRYMADQCEIKDKKDIKHKENTQNQANYCPISLKNQNQKNIVENQQKNNSFDVNNKMEYNNFTYSLQPLPTPKKYNTLSKNLESKSIPQQMQIIQTPQPKTARQHFYEQRISLPIYQRLKMQSQQSEQQQQSEQSQQQQEINNEQSQFQHSDIRDKVIKIQPNNQGYSDYHQKVISQMIQNRDLPKDEVNSFKNDKKTSTGCNCKKTKCLKLYCDCFRANQYCSDGCNCADCHNTQKYQKHRQTAILVLMERTSDPFFVKIQDNKHVKGCNCKKSNCLKKYCECYQAGLKCNINCKCEQCKNEIDHGQSYQKKEVVTTAKKQIKIKEL